MVSIDIINHIKIRNVVFDLQLNFFFASVAQRLTEQEFHDVPLQGKKHTVRVTPFLNGKISNLKAGAFLTSACAFTEILLDRVLMNVLARLFPQTNMKVCPRTVKLTGIPNIMEQESLQDLLEIHFQKNTNGGGEIEAFIYNPLDQRASALFGISSLDSEDKEE